VIFSRAKASARPPEERRRSIRHATVMQVAKIRFGYRREELCMLRDISPEGLKVEIYVDVEVGAHVEIELRTGHTIGGRVAWAERRIIGVAFDESMPMSAMLAHCSFDERLGTLRPPRLKVNMHGVLRFGGQEKVVHIGNISQAGLQITAPDPLPVGPCSISLPGLAPRPASIRWWRERQAGLLLAEPFDFTQFAEWRAVIAA
jgi:hypothetical protein